MVTLSHGSLGIGKSLYSPYFLGSGLTPSFDRICPKKSISFWANSLFALMAKSFFSLKLIQNIFQVFHVIFLHLGIQQDVINVNDHEFIQLFMED
jgi:hypothetical protein